MYSLRNFIWLLSPILIVSLIPSSFNKNSIVDKAISNANKIKIQPSCSRTDTLYVKPQSKHQLSLKVDDKQEIESKSTESKPSAFDQVASMGLAGVLAIAAAEAIFWALGMFNKTCFILKLFKNISHYQSTRCIRKITYIYIYTITLIRVMFLICV